jgi:hypothetical protein
MLRGEAKGEVGGKIQSAVKKYAEANDGMLPESLTQVQAYLEEPIELEILNRYKMTAEGKLDDLRKEHVVFEEIAAPVDDEYDTYFRWHKDGRSTTSFSLVGFMLENAAEAYANANGGRLPRQPDQFTPYLEQPIESARIQKFLDKVPPGVSTLAEMKARKN